MSLTGPDSVTPLHQLSRRGLLASATAPCRAPPHSPPVSLPVSRTVALQRQPTCHASVAAPLQPTPRIPPTTHSLRPVTAPRSTPLTAQPSSPPLAHPRVMPPSRLLDSSAYQSCSACAPAPTLPSRPRDNAVILPRISPPVATPPQPTCQAPHPPGLCAPARPHASCPGSALQQPTWALYHLWPTIPATIQSGYNWGTSRLRRLLLHSTCNRP